MTRGNLRLLGWGLDGSRLFAIYIYVIDYININTINILCYILIYIIYIIDYDNTYILLADQRARLTKTTWTRGLS